MRFLCQQDASMTHWHDFLLTLLKLHEQQKWGIWAQRSFFFFLSCNSFGFHQPTQICWCFPIINYRPLAVWVVRLKSTGFPERFEMVAFDCFGTALLTQLLNWKSVINIIKTISYIKGTVKTAAVCWGWERKFRAVFLFIVTLSAIVEIYPAF